MITGSLYPQDRYEPGSKFTKIFKQKIFAALRGIQEPNTHR